MLRTLHLLTLCSVPERKRRITAPACVYSAQSSVAFNFRQNSLPTVSLSMMKTTRSKSTASPREVRQPSVLQLCGRTSNDGFVSDSITKWEGVWSRRVHLNQVADKQAVRQAGDFTTTRRGPLSCPLIATVVVVTSVAQQNVTR